jgi:hypothetical protein
MNHLWKRCFFGAAERGCFVKLPFCEKGATFIGTLHFFGVVVECKAAIKSGWLAKLAFCQYHHYLWFFFIHVDKSFLLTVAT